MPIMLSMQYAGGVHVILWEIFLGYKVNDNVWYSDGVHVLAMYCACDTHVVKLNTPPPYHRLHAVQEILGNSGFIL